MIAGLYADRAGGDAEDWRDLMRAETWYSAVEAVDAGLADTAVSGAKAAEDEPAEDEPDEEDDAEETEAPDESEDEDPDEDEDEAAEDDDAEDDELDEDDDDEPDEDEDDDEDEAPAAKFAAAYSRFMYAGRAQAPAPKTPGQRPGQFDPDLFRAAIQRGITS